MTWLKRTQTQLRNIGLIRSLSRLHWDLLVVVLIAQLVRPHVTIAGSEELLVPGTPQALSSDPLESAPPQVRAFFESLHQSSETNFQASAGKALFLGQQVREDYASFGNEDRVVQRFALREIDVSRSRVDFFPKDLRVAYDPQTQRLEFQRWIYDGQLKRLRKTHAHVFEGVQLTGAAKDCVLRDPNVLLISTSNWGVIGGFSPVVLAAMFNAFIPLTTWYPPASAVAAGARIEKLEFLTPESIPMDVLDTQGAPVKRFAPHDLVITIHGSEHTERIFFSYRKDVLGRLRAHILCVLLLLQSANPRIDLMTEIAQVIRAEKARSLRMNQAEGRLIDAVAETADTLPLRALRNTAMVVDFEKLAALLSQDSATGTTAFERLETASTLEWTPDNWNRLHDIIQESRRAEQESSERLGLPIDRIKRSWGEVLAANIRHPEKPIASYVAELAEQKTRAKDTLTQDLKALAVAQCTPQRLAILGAAVAGDLANMATDGKVTQSLFWVVSNILGLTTNTWGVSELVNETAMYSDNLFAPFAFSSMAILLGTLLTFQPLCYVIAKSVSLIRGDRNEDGSRWSAAQAFFSYGGRMYAYLSYPVQLLLWQLAGQKNVTTAIRNAGTLTTPGALHLPFSNGSAQRAEQSMTRHLDENAIRGGRSLLIAAVAVCQVLKDKGISLDPATLLMIMKAHEAGELEAFINRLTEASPDVAWSQLASRIYAELLKLGDGGVGPIDEGSVNRYAKVMMRATEVFGQMNAPREGLSACLKGAITDSCAWAARKAKTFGVWGSASVGTILTGGTQFRFFERNRNFVATERDTNVAHEQFRHDYAGSEVLTAVSDTQRFPVAFQFNRHLDKVVAAMADAAEQCGIYGAQGGVEQSMINPIGSELINPSPLLSTLALRRDHLPTVPSGESAQDYALGTGRQAGVLQSLFTLGATLGDPNAGLARLLQTQVRRMDATMQAIQGKGLMGYVPRALALMLITLIAASQSDGGITDWSYVEVGGAAYNALLRQANVIFNKLSLVYGAAGIGLGYAMVWAPVIWVQNTLEDHARKNRRTIENIDHLLEQGMRNDEEVVWKAGVAAMKSLYAQSRMEIPERFRVSVDDYSLSLAQDFATYAAAHSPVTTVISQRASWLNNIVIGTTVSTILALALSHSMYDSNLAILPQLGTSVSAFIGTYLGVKGLKSVAPSVVGSARSIVKKCVDALLWRNGTAP